MPALEALYTATNGTTWFPANNWLQDCEPCGWDGILCNNAGRVISINLSNRSLFGALPADLDGLPFLKRIKINDNNVTGSIPAGLFNHPQLKVIDLAKNGFTGEIPVDAGDAPLLFYLLLNNNQLTGELPESIGYGILNQFHAYGNDLSGCIPDAYFAKCGNDFIFSNNPQLPWQGSFQNFCDKQLQLGARCNDGDPQTSADRINSSCECVGSGSTEEDCQESIGQACDDGNRATFRDVIHDDCQCRGINGTIIIEDIYIGLTISPNPADDAVILDLPRDAVLVTIRSGQGNTVKQFSCKSTSATSPRGCTSYP